NGTLNLGRAKLWTKHAEPDGTPQLQFGQIESQTLSSYTAGQTYAVPSLEVTFEGKAVVTFENIYASGLIVTLNTAIFDESLNLVSITQVAPASSVGASSFRLDYGSSAIDPLFPRNIWFTGLATSPTGPLQVLMGTIRP